MHKRGLLGLVLLLPLLCRGTARPSPVQRYTITDLGALDADTSYYGDTSYATGINNLGQVVGQSGRDAFLWENGRMIDLGTLGGPYSWANGLNDAGQVVGASWPAGYEGGHAFLWEKGKMTDLGTLRDPRSYSDAYAINASGQIVGDTATKDSTSLHAFLWERGKMTDLGTGGGLGSVARAINDQGQIVGGSITSPEGAGHALVWENGQAYDLGALAGSFRSTYAVGINAAGQVAGNASNPGGPYAYDRTFLWVQGRFEDLSPSGKILTSAEGINAAGQIIGNSYTPGDAISHVVLWEHGVIEDLEGQIPADSGWECLLARAINDAGQIAGRGQHNGKERAFLMTPVQ